jgi:hypothetical protein
MVKRGMANSDDAIWEMHGLLHELSGSIKAHKDRLDVIEGEIRKIQSGVGEISALRQASSNAESQRKTIFKKLDQLEDLVSGIKAMVDSPLPNSAPDALHRVADFLTTKNLLIILAFIALLVGALTVDDIKGFIPVVAPAP